MNPTYQIIAVDFDGTLCYSNWPDLGEPNQPLIDYLKQWKARGNKLILKDSLPPPAYDDRGNVIPRDPNTTYEVDLYDIVRKARSLPPGYQRDLSLIWLSELHKDPQTGEVEELKDLPDLRVDGTGKLRVMQAEKPDMLIVEGHADTECGKTIPIETEGLTPYFKT